MKLIFIINPVSGKNKGIEVGKIIKEYCKLNKLDYKIIFTKEKEDAKKIAQLYKNTLNVKIFSVGGDGTLNEVINALANSNATLGVIPVGTGNDFYRSLNSIENGKIDLGKVNDKYFANIASLGLDAEIANYTNYLKTHNLPNKLVYILGIIHEYFSFKPINITIDDVKKEVTILTICNAKYYGGGFKIAPNAKINDGLFDIIDVESLNKLQIINLITKLVKGKHLESKKVNFYRTNFIKINSLIPLNCNIDGEIIKGNTFDFSIQKEAINLDNTSRDYINICNLLKQKKLIK